MYLCKHGLAFAANTVLKIKKHTNAPDKEWTVKKQTTKTALLLYMQHVKLPITPIHTVKAIETIHSMTAWILLQCIPKPDINVTSFHSEIITPGKKKKKRFTPLVPVMAQYTHSGQIFKNLNRLKNIQIKSSNTIIIIIIHLLHIKYSARHNHSEKMRSQQHSCYLRPKLKFNMHNL